MRKSPQPQMAVLEAKISGHFYGIHREKILKKILIINGSGGVGKDTFVNALRDFAEVTHISIVEPTKNLAKQIGWNGGKSEHDRKFLSDLKMLIDDYNDYNYGYISNIVRNYLDTPSDGINLLCIDMRERPQIERAKEEFGAETVLVKRDSVQHITSNVADAGVFNMEYNYIIENDGTIEDLTRVAKSFVGLLIRLEIEGLMRQQGATKKFIASVLTNTVVENIIRLKANPESAAWVLLQ